MSQDPHKMKRGVKMSQDPHKIRMLPNMPKSGLVFDDSTWCCAHCGNKAYINITGSHGRCRGCSVPIYIRMNWPGASPRAWCECDMCKKDRQKAGVEMRY